MTKVNEDNLVSTQPNGGQTEKINTSIDKVDIVVSVARGSIGIIPWIGPLVAEVITNFIPNQRIDRIDRYLVSVSLVL